MAALTLKQVAEGPQRALGNELHAWTFTIEEIDAARRGERLLNPSMDFSNACNLNCPYCFVETSRDGQKRRRPGELDFGESIAVIDAFVAAGARTINIVGAGEPTVDPHFLSLIEYIAGKGLWPLIFTNGAVFARKPGLARHLLGLNASIVLKINSRRADIQDAIVAHPGYAAERDSALVALLDAGFAASAPTRLGADILALEAVADELSELYAWCRENNIFPMIADYIPTGRTSPNSSADDPAQRAIQRPLDSEGRQRLVAQLAAADLRLGSKSSDGPVAYYGGRSCTQILGIYVDISGDIWPCVARTQLPSGTREPLGNTRSGADIRAIWQHHPVMGHLRRSYTGACPYKKAIPSLTDISLTTLDCSSFPG